VRFIVVGLVVLACYFDDEKQEVLREQVAGVEDVVAVAAVVDVRVRNRTIMKAMGLKWKWKWLWLYCSCGCHG
jgi:hypothetical protein